MVVGPAGIDWPVSTNNMHYLKAQCSILSRSIAFKHTWRYSLCMFILQEEHIIEALSIFEVIKQHELGRPKFHTLLDDIYSTLYMHYTQMRFTCQ